MKQKIYRQGDVLIRAVKSVPAGERLPIADGVLAHGEVTGHAHRISDLAAAELFSCGNGRFMSVSDVGVSILHEEHGPIELPVGDYEVVIQREYSPLEVRNVAD